MKQKNILSRLLAFVMMLTVVLGMNAPAMADEVRCFTGTGSFVTEPDFMPQEAIDIYVEWAADYYLIQFAGAKDDVNYNIYVLRDNNEEILKDYNGTDYSHIGFFGEFHLEDDLSLWGKISRENGYISIDFQLVELDTQTHSISTGFTGTAVSDRGDYDLFLAGYFSKDLPNGTHELTAAEISSQTTAIVAHNNINGVNRNMNQSTIEEMTITVSGGQAVSITIRGRVQTSGGTLDRYTCTITP